MSAECGVRSAECGTERAPSSFLLALIPIAILAASLEACGAQGVASWYGEEHRGRLMANGRPFNPDALTAASWFYPLGTRLEVLADGHHAERGVRSVWVTITDRGPATRLVRQGRIIDLSAAAFRRLEDPKRGLVAVKVRRMR